MRRATLKTVSIVVVWSVISAAAMLVTLVPVGLAAGLRQWWLLRTRLDLGRLAAIPFALSFPTGQFPSYVLYLAVYASGFGGLDGPPDWFVPVTLASGGAIAGLCQFLGLPKSRRNALIWIPATSFAWSITALGDLNIRGMVVISALLSGAFTAAAMLALSSRPTFHQRSDSNRLPKKRSLT
jgi:hypothetical protein